MTCLGRKINANRGHWVWFLIGVFLCPGIRPAFAEQVVLIAIHSDDKEITLVGNGLEIKDNKRVLTVEGALKIQLRNKNLLINNKSWVPPVKIISKSPVWVEKKSFRGDIVIDIDSSKGEEQILLIHPMSLETYVAGIVASEVPESWPQEALNAQAVAARTYAVYQKYKRIDKKYHLSATVLDQVYGGLESEHPRARQAAEETYGVVITFDSKPIQAFFHSSCGGKTASSKEEWGSDLPYLPGGKCGYCDDVNEKEWNLRISKDDLRKNIGNEIGEVQSVVIKDRGESGRLENIEVRDQNKTVMIDASKLRATVGYGKLRSKLIDRIEKEGKEFIFYGKGFGHGVGMCQWGARGMAKDGYNASQIIAKYYPGIELRRMY